MATTVVSRPVEVVGSFANVRTVSITFDGTSNPTVKVPGCNTVEEIISAVVQSSAGLLSASNHNIAISENTLTFSAGTFTSGNVLKLILRVRGGF